MIQAVPSEIASARLRIAESDVFDSFAAAEVSPSVGPPSAVRAAAAALSALGASGSSPKLTGVWVSWLRSLEPCAAIV